MTDRQKKLALAAVVVAAATAVSRVVGLAREVLTAGYYGVDPNINTLISVSVVPNLVRQLVADAAVSAAFVPVITGLLVKGDADRARRLAGNLLGFMCVVVGAVCLVAIAVASPLMHLIYPHLTRDAHAQLLAAHILQILMPTVLVLAVGGVVTGVLYSHERFTMPAVVSIVWNLVIIGFIIFAHRQLGVYAIAWGTLAGTGLELLLLLATARAAGVGLSLHFDFRDPLLRQVLVLMVPITITLGILNFNALVDTFFAQFVNNRAAAEIAYSFRIYQLPQGIFAVTIGTILFPSLSRFAAIGESDRFRETLSMGVRQMMFVSLPFVAWFALLPRPFVQLVYQRGAFGGLATHDVAAALAGFTAGLAFANANIMFNRGFQSLKRPWLPLYAALVNLALNAVLDWVLLGPLGVAGITLSTSIVSACNFAVLVWLMRRQIGRVDGRRIVRALAGALVCAAVLAGVSWGVWRGLQGVAAHGFVALAVCVLATVAAGAVAYVGIAKALGLEELTLVWRALRRRGGASVPSAVGS